MSIQEKRIVVNIFSTVTMLLIYGMYVRNMFHQGLSDDLSRWALVILIFIPIAVGVKILTYIIFHILNAIATGGEEVEDVTDERDKLFDMKANTTGYVVVGVGFVLSMVALALKMPVYVMINVVFVSFNIAEVIGDLVKFRFYRRGY